MRARAGRTSSAVTGAGLAWFEDLPPDTEVSFDHRPEPPVPEALAGLAAARLPSYSRRGDDGGRAPGDHGHRDGAARAVAGPARATLLPGGSSATETSHRGHRRRARDRAPPQLLTSHPDAETDVTEFRRLTWATGRPVSPRRRGASSAAGLRRAGVGTPLGGRSREAALKMVGGLAAGGLGAVVRYAPKRQADPFAAATAEERMTRCRMTSRCPAGSTTGGGRGRDAAGRAPVSDEVLDLLYRGGLDPSRSPGRCMTGPTARWWRARCWRRCRIGPPRRVRRGGVPARHDPDR